MSTIVTIIYGQVDPSAKHDSRPSSPDKMPWSNLPDLSTEGIKPGNYMTCEWNYSILDGSMDEFPDDTEGLPWGWWTESLSSESGEFEYPPALDISFNEVHKSNGLTLHFYPHTGDFAARVKCSWFDASGELMQYGYYESNKNPVEIKESVKGYKHIVIELLATNNPHRYAKLYAIDYGITREIPDREVDSANVLEEVEPTTDIVSINSMSFRWKTKDPVFSPISGDLDEDMLMKRQKLSVFRDGKPFGVFFLNEWNDVNNDGTTYEFKCFDAIWVMEKFEYMGGMYENEPVGNIIEKLFEICFPTGVIKYEIDPDILEKTVTGWLPISNCRVALQQVCFAAGAIPDTSRRDYVWIYSKDYANSFSIDLDKIYLGGGVEVRTYYSGARLTAHEYVKTTETATPFKGELGHGVHTIRFSEPLHSLSISQGEILESDVNYAVIEVESGETALTGQKYRDNTILYSTEDELEPGEIPNVINYDKATLVSRDNAESLLQGIYDYFRYRVSISNEIRLGDIEVGLKGTTATRKRPVNGLVTQLDINLRGKAKMTMVGNIVVIKPEMGTKYAGDLYAGQ